MRLELTRVGLLVELANHYTARGVLFCNKLLTGEKLRRQFTIARTLNTNLKREKKKNTNTQTKYTYNLHGVVV